MKPLKLTFQILVATLLTGWSTQQAQAAFDYQILSDGGLVGGFNVSLDGASENGILVGGIHLKGLPGVPGYGDFTSLCVDLNGRIYIGSTYKFTEAPFAGETGINPTWGNPRLPVNVNTAFQAINNAAYLYATVHPNTATGWASLQLAVWKAIYDTDASGQIVWDATSRFDVPTDPTGVAWTAAQTLLNKGGAFNRPTDYVGYLLKPEDRSAQELLIGVTPVPEPATILGGLLLLIPMGVSAMRYAQKRRNP